MIRAGQHKHVSQIGAAVSLACVLALSAGPALSQEGPAPSLSLELNALQQQGDACRVIFLADNRLGTDLAGLSLEAVVINTDGIVDLLTLFDFQSLPEGRTRVRQFDLESAQCGSIGRILINGAAVCQGDGLTGAECIEHLRLETRAEAEIAG